VISGDLSQSIGAPVRRGDTLFELAPLNDYRVELAVPEQQVASVQPGQHGSLVVASLPDQSFGFTVERTTPVASSHDGRMVFQVDAKLDDQSHRLRPGMEGVGKIDAGRARLVWIWTRSLLDWARLAAWQWLP
jgi:multidrug efflux pump subunit AcrA (membrane-fusion protein)